MNVKNNNLSKIKVSVIIPFYNRVDWVIKALNSALKQTHENIEIILIDDGSTENISRILKIKKEDKRIIYFRNKKNYGAANSRNKGLKISTGAYISFLDSDDIYLPNKIAEQLNYMVKKNYLFTHCSYQTFVKEKITSHNQTGLIDYNFPKIISNCAIATPTVMIKKKFISSFLHLFPDKMRIGEDVCAWINLSKKCTLKGLNKELVLIRKHNKSASENNKKQLEGLKNIFDYVFNNHLDSTSVSELEKLNTSMFFYLNEIYNQKINVSTNLDNNIKLINFKNLLKYKKNIKSYINNLYVKLIKFIEKYL